MRNSDIFGWIDKYVLILGMIFINFQVFFIMIFRILLDIRFCFPYISMVGYQRVVIISIL